MIGPGAGGAIPLVLVVDDDPALCGSLKFALEIEGFAVRTFLDGPAALSSLGSDVPHCLVIDYRLADTNGLQLIAELRRRGITAPAILITTNPGVALQAAAEQVGAQIIEKPLLTNALSDAIRCAIGALR